jgi:acyl-CoA thioesterase I
MFSLLVITISGLAIWGYKLYRLYISVPNYAQYWNEKKSEDGKFIYVALGDSAAQGIGASEPQKGYVGLVAESIERKTGKTVKIINLSKSGATTAEIINNQLPKVQNLNAHLITLGVGANDLKNYDKNSFKNNIEIITSSLPIGTYIADTPYFMHGNWEKNSLEAKLIIKNNAENNQLNLVPLHSTLKRSGWIAMLDSYAADWFHPNDKGYQDWYEAFWSVIKNDL